MAPRQSGTAIALLHSERMNHRGTEAQRHREPRQEANKEGRKAGEHSRNAETVLFLASSGFVFSVPLWFLFSSLGRSRTFISARFRKRWAGNRYSFTRRFLISMAPNSARSLNGVALAPALDVRAVSPL